MTKLKIPQLRAGDVILYPANQTDFQHSAIVVGQGNVVHADANGGIGFVRLEDIKATERYCAPVMQGIPNFDQRWPTEVYRCKKSDLAEAAALYAQRFGRDNAQSQGATIYGENRQRGVSLQLRGDPNPPFEFDAIYRAFKWATRGSKGAGQFSAKQGATCAAFVVACYQAGAIYKLAGGDADTISACLEMIRSWRTDKTSTKVARWTAKPVGHQNVLRPDAYKRSVSNVGPDANLLNSWTKTEAGNSKAIAEDAWDQLASVMVGNEPLLAPQHYLTTAMTVDAQFVFSNTLRFRLLNDGNWTRRILDFE